MKKEHVKTCARCDKPMTGAVIATGGGQMHPECCEENAREVRSLIARAVANGTHGPHRGDTCGGCGKLSIIYNYGFDGKPYCFVCDMGMGGFTNLTERQLIDYAQGRLANPMPDPAWPQTCSAELERRRRIREYTMQFNEMSRSAVEVTRTRR